MRSTCSWGPAWAQGGDLTVYMRGDTHPGRSLVHGQGELRAAKKSRGERLAGVVPHLQTLAWMPHKPLTRASLGSLCRGSGHTALRVPGGPSVQSWTRGLSPQGWALLAAPAKWGLRGQWAEQGALPPGKLRVV